MIFFVVVRLFFLFLLVNNSAFAFVFHKGQLMFWRKDHEGKAYMFMPLKCTEKIEMKDLVFGEFAVTWL